MTSPIVQQNLVPRSQVRLNIFGVGVSCIYVVLTPLMMQNSFDPILPGRWSHLQIVDLLAPLMAIWLLLNAMMQPEVISDTRMKALIVFAFTYIAVGPISNMFNDGHIALADTGKRIYLSLTLLFFYRIFRIENVPYIILWITIYLLLIFSSLSIFFYLAYLFTGASNLFIQISNSIITESQGGSLIGPMRPTEKLFASYLLLLAGAIFIGSNLVNRTVYYISLATAFGCSLLTGSRAGALAAICIILLAISVLKHRRTWLVLLVFPILCALLLLQVSSIWDLSKFVHILETGGNLYEAIRPTTSLYMKEVAWQVWIESPIIGTGPENFPYAWLEAAQLGRIPSGFINQIPSTPNSTYLYLLFETGLIGLVGWLGMLTIPLYELVTKFKRKSGSRLPFAIWLITFAILMIDLTTVNFRFLYYMIPLIAALPHKTPGTALQKDL